MIQILCTVNVMRQYTLDITSLWPSDPIQAVNDSDFLCELYDWDQSLSCSWKIGTYRKESNIEVKVIAGTM